VGWQTSTSLRADLALDALEMAIWRRREASKDSCTTAIEGASTSRSATPSAWRRRVP
jgi:transposase InsO family protein